MSYKIKFDITDIVTLKTDKEKLERIVTGFSIRQWGIASYELAQANNSSWHYEIEIEGKHKNINIGFKLNT